MDRDGHLPLTWASAGSGSGRSIVLLELARQGGERRGILVLDDCFYTRERLGCNQPIYAIVQAAIVVRQMAIQRCCVFLHINPPTTPSNCQNKYTKTPLGKLIPANLS